MTDSITAVTGAPPPYLIHGPQGASGRTITEPTGLSPWQRRWNMEWLNEAYVPYMHHNDLLMERSSRCTNDYHLCKKTRPGTEQFMLNAIEAGITSPKSALTPTRWPCGTRHVTWPVRMLVSDMKRLWGRWRKHRENAKMWQAVAVMEEHGETPRWKAEMKFTFFREEVLKDWLKSGDPGNWIDFPSALDIKWYVVRAPEGPEWLQAGQNTRSWAPSHKPESCIPFVMVDGRVVRDCAPHNAHERADGNVFDNFVQSCPHCGRRS